MAFSTTTIVPFDVATSLKRRKIRGSVNDNGQYEFDFMVDMSETLQEESALMATQNYTSRIGRNVSVSRIEKVRQGSGYTHILTLAISKNTKPCSETLYFRPPILPKWVEKANDDSGCNIQKNMNKTTGIKYLIKGVSEAYKDYSNLATIDFRIKNN